MLDHDASPLEFVKTILTGDNLKWFVSITSAFLASLVACIFSQPGDMIVTETYKEAESSLHLHGPVKPAAAAKGRKGRPATIVAAPSPKTFASVVATIYGNGGLPEFFRGTGARMVHVGLIITSQLVIYDLVKQMLGLPATGSH
jgi:solute carrier family 25 phosphate transporter 3